MGRRRLLRHERQRIGAAFEVEERQLVGLGWIGMVDPLRDPSAGGELLLEIRAPQHALDQPEPWLAA